jgi:5'-3' exonuclease
MILIDFSQVVISNLIVNISQLQKDDKKEPEHEIPGLPGTKTVINEDLIRHMVLNTIRSYKMKFGEIYGKIIICCDSKQYWRKDVFPYYKGLRKEKRETSVLNWHLIFETLNKLKDELIQYFPYRVIEVDGAEADDIIAVIAKREHTAEKILILSGDKDFTQLQKYPNIVQYAPIQKQFLVSKNPIEDLREHIMIAGDDDIPNFCSSNDSKVKHIRQKSIRKDNLERWIKESKPENFCDIKMLHGYKRNQQLIDFEFIPKEIQKKIIEVWEQPFKESRKNLFNYFLKYKLVNLMDHIQEF